MLDIDISPAGLVGAVVGTFPAAVLYYFLVGRIMRGLRASEPLRTEEERSRFEAKMSVLRRCLLTADLALVAGLGYWIGKTVWG